MFENAIVLILCASGWVMQKRGIRTVLDQAGKSQTCSKVE
jgi:hypothetical protein